jgi:hypothetical protein
MKLSQVIRTLQQAEKDFGDIQVFLVDSKDGTHNPVLEIIKTFPYHPSKGLDRSASVSGILICDYGKNASDLVLASKEIN